MIHNSQRKVLHTEIVRKLSLTKVKYYRLESDIFSSKRKRLNYNIIFVFIFSFVIFLGCVSNGDSERKHEKNIPTFAESESNLHSPQTNSMEQGEGIIEDTLDSNVDSFKVYCAEKMKVVVNLPPVYQREIFEENNEATSKFSKLSKACNGQLKVVVNSSAVVSELESTIRSVTVNESDMVILIDRTGSMAPHIAKVKEGIAQIIDTIKQYKGTRLAIATFGDKNYEGDWWFKFKNFETDYDAAAQYVKNIQVIGNLDWPESVYDAAMSCLHNDFWKSKKKCNLILVGDAPPHEKPLSNYTLQDVINASKEGKVRMNFYPILILPNIKLVVLSEQDKAKYQKIENNTKIYPNPCKGILNLGMQNSGTYYLELYNIKGEIVMNEEYFGVSWSKDISNLPNDVYILRVIKEDHTYELFKFILQH